MKSSRAALLGIACLSLNAIAQVASNGRKIESKLISAPILERD